MNILKGGKDTLMSAGVGAVAAFAIQKSYGIDFVKNLPSPYIVPAVIVAGGHLLAQKKAAMGHALVGAGAAYAAAIFMNTGNQPAATPPPATKGFAYTYPPQAGALVDPHSGYSAYTSPSLPAASARRVEASGADALVEARDLYG